MKITIEAPTKQICTAIADSYESGKSIKFAGQKFHINGWCKHSQFEADGPSDLEIDAVPLTDKSPTAEECQDIINEISSILEIPSHMLTGNPSKSKTDTAWRDRGEFPPAGFECEYSIADMPRKSCTFVGINSRGSVVIEDCHGQYKSYHTHQIKLHPIKTEKEKFVEAAKAIIDQLIFGNSAFIAESMFETGEFKYQPKEKGQ